MAEKMVNTTTSIGTSRKSVKFKSLLNLYSKAQKVNCYHENNQMTLTEMKAENVLSEHELHLWNYCAGHQKVLVSSTHF